jgi:hypothetical protein
MCEPVKDSGGPGLGAAGFLLGACLLVSAFGWVLNIIAIALVASLAVLCCGSVGLVLWHLHRRLGAAQVQVQQRVPHIHPAAPQRQFPFRQQQPAVEQGGQHVHFYGMTPEQVAAAMRQLRGGQR